jgi:nucleotide-binding universal stress UspA family protein
MTEEKPYVILAAVDYSPSGDLAFERALTLATEKRLVAVHVVNVLPVYQAGVVVSDEGAAPPLAGSLPSIADASEQLRAYTQRKVDEFRASRGSLSLSFLDRIVAHQRVDVPSEEISRLAAEIEADLVVVGTHGRRGLTRLLLGSVAEGVVRAAPCPVLVVRPKAAPEPQPQIEPACPRCLEKRSETAGKELWCDQHSERHGPRHTYHQGDRASEATAPPVLVRG